MYISAHNGLGGIKDLVQLFLNGQLGGVIAAHIVSSISVIVFIIYFFWKPTNKFINTQKEKLDKVHTDLSMATKETKQALNNLQRAQQEFVSERKQFLKERQEKEKSILETRIQEAEKVKQEIIDEANKRIKVMEEEARKTVNQQIITLSVELAEKLIKGTINQKTQSKIIDGYLEELDTVFKGSIEEEKVIPTINKKS